MTKDRFDDYPLTPPEVTDLATFNSEVARGLVHRPGYAFEMSKLQEKVNAWAHQQNEDSGYNDWAAAQPKSVRVSSTSPYVTGGASSTQEELDAVSKEIRDHGKDRVEDAPTKHKHIFDRLHGLCRCGEVKNGG
jgi:hypothetical protein